MKQLIIHLFILMFFLPVMVYPGKLYTGASEPFPGDAVQQGPLIYEEFELIEGLEVEDISFWEELITGSYDRRRVIRLKEGAKKGRAEAVFFEPSAVFNITVHYVEGKKPGSEIVLSVNGTKVGTVEFGASHAFREKTFENVPVQQWSKITLDFYGGEDNLCRLEKIVLTPVGPFRAREAGLKKPETLKIYETYSEVRQGRRIFYDYVRQRAGEKENERKKELVGIKNSPDEEPVGAKWQEAGTTRWKARQDEVRKNLHRYFGEFPERTPLNAKVTGKIEHERYTIEKIIFESQPGFYVTANLYVPKGRKFPVPGVVFPLGHSDAGKSRDNYHMSGLGMVLKGYVVLVFDPIGQGERSEYIDVDGDWLVHLGVDQHWYVGRPAFLTDWTLSGLRTWDGIRAVDYLESRPEVDKNKLAAVGCSGGGQMAMLITAVDERIKVCAASHPGGPMENTYLTGQKLPDREIYSLIPPRPLRLIVGNESGEEPRLREYLEDMHFFYEGLRVGKPSAEIDVVPGPHSMNRSNRESAYEWLNKWFDKEKEGKAEDDLTPEKEVDLWCTESGNILISLKGRTAQQITAGRAQLTYKPETDPALLRKRVAERIGLNREEIAGAPAVKTYGTLNIQGLTVQKVAYESEPGIVVPALLIKPEKVKPGSPVIFYVSEKGKPAGFQSESLPFRLAKEGHIVFAADVRGTGETSPTPSFSSNQYTGHTPLLRIHDDLAIRSAEFGETTLGMRTRDILKGVEYLESAGESGNRGIVVAGQGLGGLWALVAAAFDDRIKGVVALETLPSYRPLIDSKYYNQVWGYFWVPGALRDFDIPDLAKLCSGRLQLWMNPVGESGEPNTEMATRYLKGIENLRIMKTKDESPAEYSRIITDAFREER